MSQSSLLNALADPHKYNDILIRRLSNALCIKDQAVSMTATAKGKGKAPDVDSSEDKRRLAMAVANAASQSLGIVAQSGWTASNHEGIRRPSKDCILCIVSAFKLVISLLRKLMPRALDLERVVSSFVGKLLTIQLYEAVLELVADIKASIVPLYGDLPCESAARNILPKAIKSTSFTRYLHLIRYPAPPPEDEVLLSLIGTSLVQALSALAALVCQSLPNDTVIDAFVSNIKEDNGILDWYSFLPKEAADTMLARAYRVLATTFSSSNTPASVLFQLRIWALRCLLCKTTLDPDPFWSQATSYIVSHGKSLIKTHDGVRAVNDAMTFFDALMITVQRRHDTDKFVSGPSFIKFCEIILVFAQRGNDVLALKRIAQFLKHGTQDIKQVTPQHQLTGVQLSAIFSQGAAMLENFFLSNKVTDLVDTLTRCIEALSNISSVFSDAGSNNNALRSFEKLRRLCGKAMEDESSGAELKNVIKRFLEAFIRGVERCEFTPSVDVAACAIDSISILARDSFSTFNSETAYEYLDRGVTLINTHEESWTSDKAELHAIRTLAKILRCISVTFWNFAIILCQSEIYSTAIRFLLPTCRIGARACDLAKCLRENEDKENVDPAVNPSVAMKDHLPRRWELLGDCYLKIGDRRLAYEALIESLKACSFNQLRLAAGTSSPSQLALDPIHSRLASLVKRITYIAVFDLFATDEACLTSVFTSIIEPEVIGLLLEWQLAGLEESLWKSESRAVVEVLLRNASRIYGDQFPIRHARVLLQQLETIYRIDDLSYPVENIAAEIHALLSKTRDTHKDVALSHFRPQYEAAAHMWMAFHRHRHTECHADSSANIFREATLACEILHKIFPSKSHSSVPTLSRRSPKVATRSSPRKKAASTTTAIPPKPHKKIVQTPPKVASQGQSLKSTPVKSHVSAIDPQLVKVAEMLSRLLGLLGHVPLKIQFLNILQKMAGQSPEASTDFIRASVDAAAEYLKLGQTQRALAIYTHALAAINDAKPGVVSDDVRVWLLLHYAEALAFGGNVQQSVWLYEEARGVAKEIEYPQPRSTLDRIRARVQILERSALASKVFSLIQTAEGDCQAALTSLKRSLRLWNRASDSLARLSSTPDRVEPNPFDMSSLAAALPNVVVGHSQNVITPQTKARRHNPVVDSLHWRIAEGLLCILFDLAQAYFQQGSARGTEFFIDQARDLARSLNSPAMISRALARKGEIQLHQGCIQEAATNLMEAAELLQELPGVDAADVTRLRAHHSQLLDKNSEAQTLYLKALSIVSEMQVLLSTIDNTFQGTAATQSPGRSSDDTLAPDLLATVLKQHIWLQRNEPRDRTKVLLERFSALPPSHHTKAEELAILAKLALHDAHIHFRTILFLSSLTESTIAIPMGLSSRDSTRLSLGARPILEILSTAEKMFWANLECVSNRGQALHEREAAVSLALIRSFQTSLGRGCDNDARVAVGLLDASAAITLRRELMDVIEQKFPEFMVDDLIWPSNSGIPEVSNQSGQTVDSDIDDNSDSAISLKAYWSSVKDRYNSVHGADKFISASQVDLLPANWTMVNISIAEDKGTMFFSRQRPNCEPILFCVPLERHGRKDEDASMQFMFKDAIQQLAEILRESDQSAKDAKEVASEDRGSKAAWWAKRVSLDTQMRDLLDNIEFCWLGAFKTILDEPVQIPQDALNNLRVQFDKVFHRALGLEKKRAARLVLDNTLMECFASLSPKCRDEELEDLVYFILDLYQFHGLHVPLSEIDIDQVTVELRIVLEEHVAKGRGRIMPVKDAHLFLVLDKNVQGIPWESIPILRGKSVSRIPSLSFLVDRVEFAKLKRNMMGLSLKDDPPPDRAVVNPKNTYYVLNPSGDLTKSESRFGAWVKDMTDSVGWQGIVGRAPSEQELLNALSNKDLVIYIGHGGAEQYVRSNKIKQLSQCAATMLWGCSSGLMRDMGDFDRTGTPYSYMLAGCPTLVACLWDVTDHELDKFSRAVFDKMRLDVENLEGWSNQSIDDGKSTSLVKAVGQSRDVCKLKYLTGSAPVVYGIPFYL